ncbi:hypothetical protein [Haliangium sp.]|uniref:hypothetical protein n=1 Tax=Haliangium sp. TaxID=2663208 RepID=UPI003D09CF17
MSDYTPVMPHGALEEVFPDVFFVTGTTRPKYMGVDWQFSRNMTVVRDGGALTLINTVRLDDAGLAALDALGKVDNVVKLGSFHGIDDPFYVDRYGATLWALPGMTHERGLSTDRELVVGGEMPFGGCSLFTFDTSAQPEGLLLLEREGGVLIACDSLQNWTEPDRYFSDDSAQKMKEFGFFAPANVGPGWLRSCEPKAPDFERVEALQFKHLLSGHGTPLRDHAKDQLAATFARLFGS